MYKANAKGKGRRLPAWALWLLGWAGAVACGGFLAYYWRVAFSLAPLPALPFTLGVCAIFSLLWLGVFLLQRFCGKNICFKAAMAVFALGLLFVFATPPLQAPDEERHFGRAYAISLGRFDYDYDRGYPEDVNQLNEKFSPPYNHGVQYAGRELAPSAFADYWQALEDGDKAPAVREPIQFMLLPYLPQALLMALARLFGFTALGALYAGRIANLAVYALLCYAIFKNCDKYRGIFMAMAMLPLSLFLAASCSADALMLALCFLAVSFFCKKEILSRDVVVFGLAVMLATYIKMPNIVLAAVLLLIPKARWHSRFNPRWAFALMLGGALAFYMVAGTGLDGLLLMNNYPADLPRGSGEEANPAGQLGFVLRYPLRFASVALLTLVEDAAYVFRLGVFGWLDVDIPLVSGLSVMSLAAASALGIQQKDDTKNTGALGLFLAALLYAGSVMLGMYLLDTDLYAIFISGTQPRYFLPAFLMLFMLCSILLGKAVRPRLNSGEALAGQAQARTEALVMWVAAGVALAAVLLLFQNYFIGQWVPLAEGGRRLVNIWGTGL